MHVSIFESLTNPKAHTFELRWDQLQALLTHTICERKNEQKLFNFCRFSSPYRSNANVIDISALLLDVDDQPIEVVQGLSEKLARYEHLGYSTHRHGLEPGVFRLRLVLSLSRPVVAVEWPAFSGGIRTWLGSALDGCVAIPSQAYYLPSCPPERAPQRLSWGQDGALLDVDALLASAPPVTAQQTTVPDTWRPEQIFTIDHLRQLPGEIAARLARGEKLADPGKRHEARRRLIFQFLAKYGPGEPDAALLHLLASSADAPRETWIRMFSSGTARAKAEAEHVRQASDEAEADTQVRVIEAIASQRATEILATAQAESQAANQAFSDQIVKDLARKAKSPITKAVLLAACSGSGVPEDLQAATVEAGRWLGYREAKRGAATIKRAFVHALPQDRERLFRGVDLGVEQATNKELWRVGLLTVEDNITPCERNVRQVLTQHPMCAGQLIYDVRADKVRVGSVPWTRPADPFWCAADAGGAMQWVSDLFGAPVRTGHVDTAIAGLLETLPRYDVVVAYLQSLPPWDETPRLSSWLSLYAGVPESPYCTAVARACLIAAVARALNPGCQADQTVVLEGYQGAGKTSLLRALCPSPALFMTLEGALSLDNVRMLHKMQGAWIAELGELSGLRRSQQEATKAFLSERTDNFRAPYGRHVLTRERRLVFFGTTNTDDYLSDTTGNRRWLPIRAGDCKPEQLMHARDQLWAEALQAFRAGERWWVAQTPDVIEAQDSRVQEHPLEGQIVECAEYFSEVSCRQIAAYLGLPVDSREKHAIAVVLRRAGYVRGPRKRLQAKMPFEGILDGTERSLNEHFWLKPDKV